MTAACCMPDGLNIINCGRMVFLADKEELSKAWDSGTQNYMYWEKLKFLLVSPSTLIHRNLSVYAATFDRIKFIRKFWIWEFNFCLVWPLIWFNVSGREIMASLTRKYMDTFSVSVSTYDFWTSRISTGIFISKYFIVTFPVTLRYLFLWAILGVRISITLFKQIWEVAEPLLW